MNAAGPVRNGRFKVNGRSSWKVVVAGSGSCRAIAGGGHV